MCRIWSGRQVSASELSPSGSGQSSAAKRNLVHSRVKSWLFRSAFMPLDHICYSSTAASLQDNPDRSLTSLVDDMHMFVLMYKLRRCVDLVLSILDMTIDV